MGMTVLGDGILASVSTDKSIRWWTTSHFPKQHNSKVIAIEWSVKGQFALSADVFCLKLWRYSNSTLDIITQISFEAPCITAVAFINDEGSRILCGIHTVTPTTNIHAYMLHEYDFTNSELKPTNEILLTSEVTKIEWSSRLDKVLVALKSGDLCYTDGQLYGFTERKIRSDWILSVKIVAEDLFILATRKNVELYRNNYASVFTSEHEKRIIFIFDNRLISAQCLNERGLIVGDSKGCLFRKTKEDIENAIGSMKNSTQDTLDAHTKIISSGTPSNMHHSSSITGICQRSNLVFTSSTDRTIKVWQGDNLKQIGQFNHVSSITCLSSWSHPKNGNQTQLLFGTESGEVQLLRWTGKTNSK